MPNYLFTSDQRIASLLDRIKWVANYINAGQSVASIADKSENNNAATLKFYYNLHFGTETCEKAAAEPLFAVRNFVKKFQFPNTRTPDSLADSINEKMLFAPFRSVVKVLYLMAIQNENGISDISQQEILYFLFCNPSVFTNPIVDYKQVIEEIIDARKNNLEIESKIDSKIKWNQYIRQSRELLMVLPYAYPCYKFLKGRMHFSMNSPNYENYKDLINDMLTYNQIWIPSDSHNFNLANKEYISYMDTSSTPYNVIDFSTKSIMKRVNIPKERAENETTLSYLTALRTKPFMLLAGISGTGKSRIVRKLAQASVTEELQKQYDPKSVANGFCRWELHKPANFELIQVKPNWHNSLEVVGYKSNIGGEHYEFTPFVEFVARAWKNPNVPFFLCLDEMNLAPVEQYFAEFLSAIESRSFENNEYETDPIIKPFIEFGSDLWRAMVNHLLGEINASDASSDSFIGKLVERFKTKGLTLPQNLIVMGTVNMDETTFSFSRKVLDRAMSVVMNKVEYNKFFSGESENDVEELNDEEKRWLIERPIIGIEAEDNGANEVESYLTAINAVLEDSPFKLGYRAANEALLYVSAAHKFNPHISVKAALDEFTLMKILSRVEGDKRSIGSLLDNLGNVINGDYPKSNMILGKMAKTLSEKQFVSYWT